MFQHFLNHPKRSLERATRVPATRACAPRLQNIALLVACVLLSSPGCDGGPATYPVSGKISYEGQPVTSGLINFQAADGKLWGGGIQSDGSYEYQIPAGEYQVRIDSPPPMPPDWEEGDPPPKPGSRQVPSRYSRFNTSKLTAEVDAEAASHEIDFALP